MNAYTGSGSACISSKYYCETTKSSAVTRLTIYIVCSVLRKRSSLSYQDLEH